MCIHDKYPMIRMNVQAQEIDVAISQVKGKMNLCFEDFLPH